HEADRHCTSPYEYPLTLPKYNAYMHMTETGLQLGCIADARWDQFNRKRDAVAQELERLRSTWVNPRNLRESDSERVFGKALEREYTLFTLLKRPSVHYADLLALKSVDGASLGQPADGAGQDPAVARQVEIAAKYDGYIARPRVEG